MKWLEKCFIPQAEKRNISGKPILLLCDGHHSHETLEMRELADQSNIVLFKIPPHTTHRLQPLDVGIFGPLQRAWQKQCLQVLDETGLGVTRPHLVREYMKAHTVSLKEKVILSAWKKTGIRPFNPQIFTREDFGPSFVSSTNRRLPDLFPVLGQNDDCEASSEPSYSSSEDGLYGGSDTSDSEGEDNEGEEGGGDDGDKSEAHGDNAAETPDLNQANRLDLPVSAESTPLLSQRPSPPIANVENNNILCEEGGGDPSAQPNAGGHSHPRRPLSQYSSTPVHSAPRQTRSMVAQSISRSVSLSATPVTSFNSPEEQLLDAKRCIQELEDTQHHLIYMNQGLQSQLQLSSKIITQLQGQLHAKETKRGVQSVQKHLEQGFSQLRRVVRRSSSSVRRRTRRNNARPRRQPRSPWTTTHDASEELTSLGCSPDH
jgi:hypothetical protein